MFLCIYDGIMQNGIVWIKATHNVLISLSKPFIFPLMLGGMLFLSREVLHSDMGSWC